MDIVVFEELLEEKAEAEKAPASADADKPAPHVLSKNSESIEISRISSENGDAAKKSKDSGSIEIGESAPAEPKGWEQDLNLVPNFDETQRVDLDQLALDKDKNVTVIKKGNKAPEPAPMPGYSDEVIMAAGAFTGGASIELSADAPLRKPYAVYMQGGLHFYSAKAGILLAANRLLTDGIINIEG